MTPNIFDNVMVHAYGDKFPLKELAQWMLRGETNLLVSMYDDSLKESTMKALNMHDSELEVTIEGKYISVKMTKIKDRSQIVNEAK